MTLNQHRYLYLRLDMHCLQILETISNMATTYHPIPPGLLHLLLANIHWTIILLGPLYQAEINIWLLLLLSHIPKGICIYILSCSFTSLAIILNLERYCMKWLSRLAVIDLLFQFYHHTFLRRCYKTYSKSFMMYYVCYF